MLLSGIKLLWISMGVMYVEQREGLALRSRAMAIWDKLVCSHEIMLVLKDVFVLSSVQINWHWIIYFSVVDYC